MRIALRLIGRLVLVPIIIALVLIAVAIGLLFLIPSMILQPLRGARKSASLSAEFVAANRSRLDAIGEWSVEADPDNLDIHWREPSQLRDAWMPFDLRFHTDGGGGSFDPDGRMFELWEMFHFQRTEFVRQLRGLVEDATDEFGTVETACVVVSREGDRRDCFHSLRVEFTSEGDDEHLYWAEYDESTGKFESLDY